MIQMIFLMSDVLKLAFILRNYLKAALPRSYRNLLSYHLPDPIKSLGIVCD